MLNRGGTREMVRKLSRGEQGFVLKVQRKLKKRLMELEVQNKQDRKAMKDLKRAIRQTKMFV